MPCAVQAWSQWHHEWQWLCARTLIFPSLPPDTGSTLALCYHVFCKCPRASGVGEGLGTAWRTGMQSRWNTFVFSCWSAEACKDLFIPFLWLPRGKRWHLAGWRLPEPRSYELGSGLYHGSPSLAERNRSFLAGICRGTESSQPWFNLDRSRWWEDCVLSWSFPLNSCGVEGSAINRHSILFTLVQFCLQLLI